MEEAIQFNVRVADQMAKELEHVQRSGIQVKAECDADTASRLSAGLAKSSSNDTLEIPLRDDDEEKRKLKRTRRELNSKSWSKGRRSWPTSGRKRRGSWNRRRLHRWRKPRSTTLPSGRI